MSLKPYQYNAIMRSYDDRQAASRALLDARQAEITRTLPAYGQLHQQIIENSMDFARNSLLKWDWEL